jgi:predicted transcriptional regulator
VTKKQRERDAWAYVTLINLKRGRLTIATLAEHLGCSRSEARYALNALRDAGYIECRGYGKAAVWKVLIPLYTGLN